MSSSLYPSNNLRQKNSLNTNTKGLRGGRGEKNASVFQNQPANIYETRSNKGEICILGKGWGPLLHINIKGCRVVSPCMRLILVELREERKKKCTSRTRFIMRGVQIQAGWYSTYIETAVAMKITHLFLPYKKGAAVHQHYNQRLLTTKSHKIIHTQ
jgi:hypothetical protein